MAAIRWPATPEEYLQLAQALAELVGGRTDVAARFYDFEENGRRVKGWGPWKGRRVSKGYKPLAGETPWVGKNFKSGEAEYRILNPLSLPNLVEHLRGKERLGVYVLDAQVQCQFLAADFDDHDGQLAPLAVWAEVMRFVKTCETHAWQVRIERSKSGKGYHVWLFFDMPVEAAKARAVGRWLFEESQSLREGEDFDTFDRFFPAQSVLPPAGKGFGNLIGLPLCGAKEYTAGKTAWVDKDGQVLADAIGYTLGILASGRNAGARVDAFMAEWKLNVEAAETYAGGPRDPNAKLGTPAEFDAMRSRCAFVRWAADPVNQPKVKEPLWYGLVSNLCRFDVDDAIHDASRAHPGYAALETELKIQHARGSSGPHKCLTIQREGFTGCPKGGCKLSNGEATAAPAGLAIWGAPREAPPKKRDRTVRIEDPGTPTASPPVEPSDKDEQPWAQDVAIHPDTQLPWPTPVGGMQVSIGGVQDHSNQYISLRPLWVDALTRNYIGQWGISIRFFDIDWKLKTHAIPRERLHEQGGVLGRELAAYGLPIVPGKEKWVSRYLVLQEAATLRRIRAAGRLGWFDAPDSPAVFVLPDQVLGKSPEEIVYQPDVPMTVAETLHGQGSLKHWQTHVAQPCLGNPVLMFSVMLGLAGPLLKLCQEQSGGFHLYGVTTAGKTTAAQMAASVWGCAADPQEGPEVTSLRKWYTTGNALESLAEVHNDMLLTLDEISEVDPHELGRIIYQLAGGLSKGRANAGGGLRMMRAWRLLFFSTGEKSVRQMLAQAGQLQKGGQRVRLPDIPADNDEDGGRAIVMDPHGQSPKEFIQDLKAACARYYGLAGPVFATYLIAEAERLGMSVLAGELRDELRSIEQILSQDVEHLLPPEGRRVIRRFALVALAGARAQMAGVLSWDLGVALAAVKTIRDRWLSDQGQEHSELDRALAYLRNQLIRHSDRFRWIGGAGSNRQSTRDLLGFRTKDYYLITEEGLRELCSEHDTRAVLRALKTQGHLWHDKDRLTRKSPRIEEYGNTRPNLYWVAVAFLGTQEEFDTEEDAALGPVSKETGRKTLDPQDDIPF
ncbi:MAG: DUF927 domain-containing protein [Pseudomonadota bacterium]